MAFGNEKVANAPPEPTKVDAELGSEMKVLDVQPFCASSGTADAIEKAAADEDLWVTATWPHSARHKLGWYNSRVVFLANGLALIIAAVGFSWGAISEIGEIEYEDDFLLLSITKGDIPNMICGGTSLAIIMLFFGQVRLFQISNGSLDMILMEQCDISGDTGSQTWCSQTRRRHIRCWRAVVPVMVPVNVAAAILNVVWFSQYTRETPSQALTIGHFLAIIFGWCLGITLATLLPLLTIIESAAHKVYSLTERMDTQRNTAEKVNWDDLIEEYRNLDLLAEKLSSPQHLLFVVVALIAFYVIMILVCCFSILACPMKTSGDVATFMLFAILACGCLSGLCYLLLQLASIDELANNRHFRKYSVVSQALKYLGCPSANMTEYQRRAHRSFLLYTTDNLVGINLFGVHINNALVSQVALRGLIGTSAAVGALKTVIESARK